MSNSAITYGPPTLLETSTLSGSSNVELGGFTLGYYCYRVVLTNIDTSWDCELRLRFSIDGGSTFVSSTAYRNAFLYADSSTLQGAGDINDSTIDLIREVGGATNESVNLIIDIYNPTELTYTHCNWIGGYTNNAGTCTAITGAGVLRSTSSVEAVQIYPSTGTFSGEARLYGIEA